MNNSQDPQDQIEALQDKMDELVSKVETQSHDGMNSIRINLFDVFGVIQTVSVAPTGTPSINSIYDQFKIYKNGTTYRFYWFDAANNQWRYATGT